MVPERPGHAKCCSCPGTQQRARLGAGASNPQEKGLGHPKCSCLGKGTSKGVPGIPHSCEELQEFPVPVLQLDLNHEHQGISPCFKFHFSKLPKFFFIEKTFPEPVQLQEGNENQISYTCRDRGGLNTGSHLEFSGIGSGFGSGFGSGTKPSKAALSVSPTLLRLQIPQSWELPYPTAGMGSRRMQGRRIAAAPSLHPSFCSIPAPPSLGLRSFQSIPACIPSALSLLLHPWGSILAAPSPPLHPCGFIPVQSPAQLCSLEGSGYS